MSKVVRHELYRLRGGQPIQYSAGPMTPPVTPPVTADPVYGPITLADANVHADYIDDTRLHTYAASSGINVKYVKWTHARTLGQDIDLETQFASMASNEVLVLPQDETPFWVDASNGFRSSSLTPNVPGSGRLDVAMARTQMGLVGSGLGTVICTGEPGNPRHTDWTGPKQLSKDGGVRPKLIEAPYVNCYAGNFVLTADDLREPNKPSSGIAFHGITTGNSGGTLERIASGGKYGVPGWRGFRNSPGGEAGCYSQSRGTGVRTLHCEADARDFSRPNSDGTGGLRVGTSPFMWNNMTDPYIEDCYGHHALAGMPTFYGVVGAHSLRLRSEYNGTGPSGGSNTYEPGKGWGLAGAGINHEMCTGVWSHVDPTMVIDSGNSVDPSGRLRAWEALGCPQSDVPSTGNSTIHLSVNSDRGSSQMVVRLRTTSFDRGPYAGYLSLAVDTGYGAGQQQLMSDIQIVDFTTGAVIPSKRRT